VAAVQRDRVHLGISAPAAVPVDRQEVRERRLLSPCPPGRPVEEACPRKEDDRCQ
jgi:hypothetical protein